MGSISREEKSYKITPENDKLFSKLLSRESSFRVYYGAAPSTVPFVWETRPGTPKHNSAANCEIPPLTPPPSYFTAGGGGSRSKLLLHSLFRRMNPKRAAAVSHSSSTSSSFSSSSSQSDPISTPAHVRRRRRVSSFGSSFDLRSSRICFGIGGGGSSVKRALLSIVGR